VELEVGVMVEIHHQWGIIVVQQLADQEVLVQLQIFLVQPIIMAEAEVVVLIVRLLLLVQVAMEEVVQVEKEPLDLMEPPIPVEVEEEVALILEII
jgi:hypothetical protein